jgi:hypothetical protein
VVDVDRGPGNGRDPSYTAAMGRLAAADVGLLGYVDLAYVTRPVAELVTDVGRWAGYPVQGIFFDRAPVSPYAIGPVAIAVQAARRATLSRVILNPGAPPDPSYRGLGVPICVFDGPWPAYQRWTGDGAETGDGHLVHDVPPWDLDEAAQLQVERGAGFGVVTDLGPPDPFADLPAWCGLAGSGLPLLKPRPHPGPVSAADGAGTSGTKTTSGS